MIVYLGWEFCIVSDLQINGSLIDVFIKRIGIAIPKLLAAEYVP